MTGLIQVLGVIFGIVLILVGILESFFFRLWASAIAEALLPAVIAVLLLV